MPGQDFQLLYAIDARDRIVRVGPRWPEFACAWRSGDVRPESAVGRPFSDFVRSVDVRHLFETLFERVRSVHVSIFMPMRCDTVDSRRLVDVGLRPLADGSIEHVAALVWSEARPAVALLDASRPRKGHYACCSWCMRVQTAPKVWEEIEDAQHSLGIAQEGPVPALRPAVCAACRQSILDTFPVRAT